MSWLLKIAVALQLSLASAHAMTCNGIFSASAPANPYVALFARDAATGADPAAELLSLVRQADLPAVQAAERFWRWLSKNRPDVASREEAPYIQDVIEASFPLYRRYPLGSGVDLEAFRAAVSDLTLRISNQAPLSSFYRSGRLFRIQPGIVDFQDELLEFAAPFLGRIRSQSDRILALNPALSEPKQWASLRKAIASVEAEVQKRKRVSLAYVLTQVSKDLNSAHDRVQAFRTAVLSLQAELAETAKLRTGALQAGLEKMSALSTDLISFEDLNDDGIRAQMDSVVLGGVVREIGAYEARIELYQSNLSELLNQAAQYDSILWSIEELLVPQPSKNELVRNDPRLTALKELALQLGAKP